jgi:hypothetical protein
MSENAIILKIREINDNIVSFVVSSTILFRTIISPQNLNCSDDLHLKGRGAPTRQF